MKKWATFVLLGLVLSGCASKPKANPQARELYFRGQREGKPMVDPSQAPSVWVVGNVRTPLIPWHENLTLSQAILAAQYLPGPDPSKIAVLRAGQATVFIDPQQLIRGQDMPLEPGDRIEIRP